MVNRGAVPVNTSTEIGRFRVLANDMKYVTLDPPEAGFGNFTFWSDDEITAYLATSQSPGWAAYRAYLQLATSAALEAKNIKDQDLAVNTEKRAELLRQIALQYRVDAEEEDAALGLVDEFVIVPVGGACDVIPEGAIPQWGRKYTWGPVC